MPDEEETSSSHPAIETLEELLCRWDEGPEQARNSIRVNVGTLREAAGYATQLEAMLAYACGEPDPETFIRESLTGEEEPEEFAGSLQQLYAERNEARAERGLLHDALERVCRGYRKLWNLTHPGEDHIPPILEEGQEVLAGAEAGDTVARVREEARREAFEEAARVAESVDEHLEWTETPGGHREHDADRTARNIADRIRALAEGDEEGDPDA